MNRINYLLIIFILFSASSSQAQVTAILQQPPAFQFSIKDLYKVTLINPGGEVRVHLTAAVTKNNLPIIDATTSDFTLPNGTMHVNAQDLSPISIDKHDNKDIEETLTRTGTFESGVYTVCIVVINDSSGVEIGGNSCDNTFEIINATKMELLSPEDNNQVLLLLPSFTWLPPLPLPPGERVSYQFQIVEILNLQTREYAFQANPLYFYSNKISTTLFQYPIAAKPLINNKKYAWKIVTYIGNDILVESPVWEFTYNGNSKNDSTLNKQVRNKLKKEMSNTTNDNINESSGKIRLNKEKKSLLSDIPFPKSLAVVLGYEYNEQLSLNSEVPKNFGSITVDVGGSPFGVNLYFDTQQQELKQTINSLGLFLDPSTIKNAIGQGNKDKGNESSENPLEKIFSYFDNIGIGDTYPDYTPYTVSGVKMTGADIAINPGLLYFAISGVNSLDAIPGVTFARKIIAGSLGVGSKDKSHFHFIMMKGWDSQNSIDINSVTNGVTPANNIIFGADASYNLLKDELSIKAAVNGSQVTQDVTAPKLDDKDLPGVFESLPFLKDLLDPNISTQVDYMYEFRSTYKSKDIGTNAEILYRYVGPGYISFGAPNIRQDIQTIKLKVSNPFVNKRILASVFFKIDKNNIANLNSTTSTSKGFGFNLKVNFAGYPYVLVDYSPSSVSNDAVNDSLSFINNSDVLLISSGMNFNSKKFVNSANLVFSNISSSSNSAVNDYSILNLNLSDNLSFLKMPLTFTGNIGYTINKGFLSFNALLFDLSAGYTFFEKWNNSLGASYYSEENINSKSTIYFNSNYTISKYLSFTFNILKDLYSEVVPLYGETDNLVIRAGITSNFK